MNKTALYIIAIYVLWNIVTFALFGIDKKKAKRGEWRIPEKTLLITAFLFGGVGAYAGMLTFRHKTKHTGFTVLIPLFALIGLIAVIYICYRVSAMPLPVF